MLAQFRELQLALKQLQFHKHYRLDFIILLGYGKAQQGELLPMELLPLAETGHQSHQPLKDQLLHILRSTYKTA
jgi:hypothetical protein